MSNVAKLYFEEIVRLYGVPRSITSYQDIKFVSHFRKTLWVCFDTSLNFIRTTHFQNDRQIKVMNYTLDNMIQCLCNDKPKWWDIILAQAEFAFNSTMHSSTGKTPIEIVYVKAPKNTLDLGHLSKNHGK